MRYEQNIQNNKGFTLVELLVVIAIVVLLASTVITFIAKANKKSRDARRMADFKEVQKALQMYYAEHGTYPTSPNNCCAVTDHNQNFNTVVQTLVNEGYIPAVPHDPLESEGKYYMLYNYGSGSSAGMLMVTQLETIGATTTPPYNSCRPFTNNWCSHTQASTQYCLCNLYQ